MKDNDKKMKRYLRAIRRRLSLPGKLKDRVMADFASSVQAGREAGKTDEEIYREFGSPKEAAAVLNEQMKDYTFRKSPWRFLFGAAAVYGAARILGSLISRIITFFVGVSMSVGKNSTVGIIGGADGPTAIFVTSPQWTGYIWPVVLLIVGVAGFALLSRCKRK